MAAVQAGAAGRARRGAGSYVVPLRLGAAATTAEIEAAEEWGEELAEWGGGIPPTAAALAAAAPQQRGSAVTSYCPTCALGHGGRCYLRAVLEGKDLGGLPPQILSFLTEVLRPAYLVATP